MRLKNIPTIQRQGYFLCIIVLAIIRIGSNNVTGIIQY